jgi:ribosome-binding protein aMBF1 (putative translation factor)
MMLCCSESTRAHDGGVTYRQHRRRELGMDDNASTDDGSEIIAALGAAIREHRTAAGLSQTKLAQLAGISRVYLNTVEAGNKCPTVVVLVHLARGLGVDPAQLLEKQPVSTAPH